MKLWPEGRAKSDSLLSGLAKGDYTHSLALCMNNPESSRASEDSFAGRVRDNVLTRPSKERHASRLALPVMKNCKSVTMPAKRSEKHCGSMKRHEVTVSQPHSPQAIIWHGTKTSGPTRFEMICDGRAEWVRRIKSVSRPVG